MTRPTIGLTAIIALAFSLAGTPAFAQEDTFVTGAGAGVYPADTSFNSVPLSGLTFGMGVTIAGGTAAGQFQTTLLGTSALGQPQEIVVEGKPTSGSSSSATTATFSGTTTIDMGDGTAPLTGVPFTVTIVTNADGQGSLTLVLGSTTLPAATINEGTMAIK